VSDDLSEFEEELADVVDPSPFHYRPELEHNGAKVFELLDQMTPLLVHDIVRAMNEGRPAVGQYLNQRDGVAVTFVALSTSELIVKVQLPAGCAFITTAPLEDVHNDAPPEMHDRADEPGPDRKPGEE
jgi:hypothetical protein